MHADSNARHNQLINCGGIPFSRMASSGGTATLVHRQQLFLDHQEGVKLQVRMHSFGDSCDGTRIVRLVGGPVHPMGVQCVT